MFVINGPAVVLVNQAQIPDFTTPVKIGNAGRSYLQEGLRERVEHSGPRDRGLEFSEVSHERAVWGHDLRDEIANSLFVLFVGIEPARMNLGLSEGFDHVLLNSSDE